LEVVNALNRGPVSARLRRWLKKVIKLDEVEITPEALRDGIMVYALIPVRSAAGEIVRLKQEIRFTQTGQAFVELNYGAGRTTH
jgi:hypothetical protein